MNKYKNTLLLASFIVLCFGEQLTYAETVYCPSAIICTTAGNPSSCTPKDNNGSGIWSFSGTLSGSNQASTYVLAQAFAYSTMLPAATCVYQTGSDQDELFYSSGTNTSIGPGFSVAGTQWNQDPMGYYYCPSQNPSPNIAPAECAFTLASK